MKKHPNAIASLVSGATIGSGVVALVQHWFGWKLSPQSGLYVGTGVITVALFVGRNGAVGTWRTAKRIILHGTRGS